MDFCCGGGGGGGVGFGEVGGGGEEDVCVGGVGGTAGWEKVRMLCGWLVCVALRCGSKLFQVGLCKKKRSIAVGRGIGSAETGICIGHLYSLKPPFPLHTATLLSNFTRTSPNKTHIEDSKSKHPPYRKRKR